MARFALSLHNAPDRRPGTRRATSQVCTIKNTTYHIIANSPGLRWQELLIYRRRDSFSYHHILGHYPAMSQKPIAIHSSTFPAPGPIASSHGGDDTSSFPVLLFYSFEDVALWETTTMRSDMPFDKFTEIIENWTLRISVAIPAACNVLPGLKIEVYHAKCTSRLEVSPMHEIDQGNYHSVISMLKTMNGKHCVMARMYLEDDEQEWFARLSLATD